METTWQIKEDPADRSTGLVVAAPEPEASWPHFFAGVRLRHYPEVIEAVAQEIGAGDEAVGVTFPGDLDEFDRLSVAIPENGVKVYVLGFDDSILPRATFYTVLLAFAERLLMRPGQPADWYKAMQTALDKLRAKMRADASAPPLGT